MIQEEDFKALVESIVGQGARLIAVSKFQSIEKIEALYAMGQRDFAENYVQELVTKYEYFKDKPGYDGINWHFIGHLQRNKVKYIAPFVHTIHSIDSLRLLQEVQKEAQKNNRNIQVLLQLHVAQEETKFGLDQVEVLELLETIKANPSAFDHIICSGIMGMASFSDDEMLVKSEFKELRTTFTHIKTSYYLLQDSFKELSMGMSADYEWAIQEGSTMVRIGSMLFGKR